MKTAFKSESVVDSVGVYSTFWKCWHLCGIATTYNVHLCGFYDLLVNIFITIFYPVHLIIGVFVESSRADLFKNLSINITCIACSIKHYLWRYKLSQIIEVQRLLGEMDQRVSASDEREFYSRGPQASARRAANLLLFLYVNANIAAILMTLLSPEPRLMYPGWFPFDWRASTFLFYLALCYQIGGITMQIVQNIANDIYVPMTMCIIGGHVRLLGMRVEKIGYGAEVDPVSCNAQLLQCIEDHKKLLRILKLSEDALSYAQLVQFFTGGLNMCIVLIYILFYVDSFFSYVYYMVYFVAMAIELFPSCYYGSILQEEFYDLTYAIFRCNWLQQSREFQQNQRTFIELSLKPVQPLAGGIIAIHLNAFIGTCKMAYSLYTFFTGGLNMCIVLIYILFYVDSFFSYVYYMVYFVAMAIELFPSCYYGSILQEEFYDLTYTIFRCNWLQQSREFQQNQRPFIELSLKPVQPLAGGIFAIHLNAFIGTCKMAYSLYTVIRRIN